MEKNTQDKQTSQIPSETEPEAQVATLTAEDPQARHVEAALMETQAKMEELQENFLRAKAETENMRRRSQDDVAKAHKFAIEGFAESLLPVLDSLEAALEDTSNDPAKMREGVDLTLRQLLSALEKGRVTVINPDGAKFDPNMHHAVSMVPAEQEANTVVTVLQKGYTIAERVLRPALVTVAQPK